MNIIEVLLGISPDGGSGATELSIGALVVIVLLITSLRWRRAFGFRS
jgi:hypothetical protein